MSTQRYHFLTIVGRSARELEATCEAILARQPAEASRPPAAAATRDVFNDHTPAVQARIERLCRSLIDAADALPVVHHATHVDGWTMGNYGLVTLDWPDGRRRAVATMGQGVAIYPRRQDEWFLTQAAKVRRRASRPVGLWGWYPTALTTALQAGRFFKNGRYFKLNYVVAVVTECLGATREDYEIVASKSTLIPGIKPGRGDPALTKEYAELNRQRKVLERQLMQCVDPQFRTSSSGRAQS
jgi:hypothetical protein